jgi:hypothetical protein
LGRDGDRALGWRLLQWRGGVGTMARRYRVQVGDRAMKILLAAAIAAAMALGGCINVRAPDVNVDLGDDGGWRTRDKDDDNDGSSRRSGPSQLPDSGSGSSSWGAIVRDVTGKVTLAAEHGVVFYAFDTLAYPGREVDLAVRLQSGRDLKGIPGVTVAFYDGKELLALGKTDGRGRLIRQWTPPAEGDYHFTARIVRVPEGARMAMLDVSPAPLLVAARDSTTKLVVIDLDHTVVDSSFFRVLMGGAKPMPGSVEVVERIAEVYSIVYLTHRPDLLTRKSKIWLSRNGYPAGPLLVSELSEAVGDSGKFKTAKLRAIRKAYPNVMIGIGDKLSDAQAYVDNGLTAYLIPHCKDKPKDMRKMSGQVRGLRGRGRLHVVDGWDEIEAGVFRSREFPPDDYARRLRRRADRLEDEKRDRKRREKDDDDDDDDD